jgi:hypothetical protein
MAMASLPEMDVMINTVRVSEAFLPISICQRELRHFYVPPGEGHRRAQANLALLLRLSTPTRAVERNILRNQLHSLHDSSGPEGAENPGQSDEDSKQPHQGIAPARGRQ